MKCSACKKEEYSCKDHATNEPRGYVQWHHWAEEKTKTHEQLKCPECGLYKIWVKKIPAPKKEVGE